MRCELLLVLASTWAVVVSPGCDSDGAWLGTPRILFKTQPEDTTALDTLTATFTAEVVGPGPITYSWETSTDGGFTWASAPGGTNSTSYTTPPTICPDSGTLFRCMASSGAESAYSDTAVLTVTPARYRVVDLVTGDVSIAAGVPDLLTNDEYKTTKIVLKLVQPGTFQMGDETGLGGANELPVHTVNITKPFYVGVFEVTQRQWAEVEGTWPSYFTTSPDKLPVEQVSWNDCQAFLANLSSFAAFSFRLPTEAEWEYSCKAGTHTTWSHGSEPDNAYLWCASHANNTTHEVGTRLPNPWGLYDMHGNVNEFCEDYYESPYPPGEVSDPTGPAAGTSRVFRGGGFASFHEGCRSSFRGLSGEAGTDIGGGFRMAASVPSL